MKQAKMGRKPLILTVLIETSYVKGFTLPFTLNPFLHHTSPQYHLICAPPQGYLREVRYKFLLRGWGSNLDQDCWRDIEALDPSK